MKTKLLPLFTLLLSIASFSQTFTVGNLNYEIIDADLQTVRVIGGTDLPRDLVIPQTVIDPSDTALTYTITTIGNSAFRNRGLSSVVLPETLTTLEFRAFRDNRGITSIIIPASVTTVGVEAFFRNSLTKVVSQIINPPTVSRGAFGDRSIADLIIPEGTEIAYENANWTDFQSVSNFVQTPICQDITVFLDRNGLTTITGTDIDDASIDNVGITSFIAEPNSFDCSNLGENQVTLTITNRIGNSASCTAIVTVQETVSPTVVCKDITVQLDNNNEAFITAADVELESNDNCTVGSKVINNDTFGLANIGDNEVILTVTDISGNVGSCTAVVTVVPNDVPAVNCKDITVQLDATGQVSISGTDVDAGSTDIVGIANYSVSPDTFDCSNIGDNEVVLTVTNTRGNSSTCNATVTIENLILPTISCPGDIIQDCVGFITYAQPIFSDTACGYPEVPVTVNGFELLGTFGNSTYFISDEPISGEQAFAAVEENGHEIITINNQRENDFIRAQVAALGFRTVLIGYNDLAVEGVFEWQSGQPATFSNFDEGEPNDINGEDLVELISNSGLWNDIPQNASMPYIIEFHNYDSGEPIQISGIPSGGFFASGTTINTFYVEDNNGIGSTCSFTISINDVTDPGLTCAEAITVDHDPSECGATIVVMKPVVVDDCGSELIPDTFNIPYIFDSFLGELQNTPGTLKNVSESTRDVLMELTFNGDHNNSTKGFVLLGPDSSIVFSGADFDPGCEDVLQKIIIPQDTWNNWITVFGSDLIFTLQRDTDVEKVDCESSSFNFYRLRLPEFGNISLSNDFTGTSEGAALYPVGTTTVTWTATDQSGNSTTCTQTITVNDTEAPNAICQEFTARLDETGQVIITAESIDAGSTDNCAIDTLSITPDTFTADDLGDNEVTLTVVDQSGNEASCTAIVTVINDDFPLAICQNISVQLDENDTVTIVAEDVDGGSSDTTGIATLSVTPSSFDCADVGDNVVTLTVTNTLGNSVSCEAIVTVIDSTPPTIICPSDITLSNDTGLCEAEVIVPLLSEVINNCGSSTIMPDTGNVQYLFDEEGLIDTPSILSGVTAATKDVILKLNFSGDHNSTSDEFRLNGPDNKLIFAETDIDPVCVQVERSIVIPQATWNDWITNFGTDLTFTLLRDTSVERGDCNTNGDFYRVRLPQFGNISIVNDYTNRIDASGIYPIGSTLVTWMVEDLAGNTTICEQIITVNDTEAPVISCPEDIVVTSCESTVVFDLPEVTDNCAEFDDSLEAILKQFNRSNKTTTTLIPNPFDFVLDEGLNSDNIDDGGDDMYDDGNFISTDLSSDNIVYSDNAIVNSTDFGPNGAYVTRKVENLWLLAADLDGITDFNITGELGADSDGLADGFSTTITVDEITYSIFVKRVREDLDGSGGDPSVNHLIIIPENVNASQNFAEDTDDDQHQVTGLEETTRLYYLLFASVDSGFVDNIAMQAIATSFISNIATPKGSIIQTAGIPSGSDYPIGETINTFLATDQAGNTATCSFTVTVEDRSEPQISCPSNQTVASDEVTNTYQLPDYFANSEAIATGTCDNPLITFTQNPVPGTLLEAGVTTVTLCAADALGNEICCSFAITVNEVLSIDDLGELHTIVTYPNPVKSIVHISNPNKVALNGIAIYDLHGRLILTEQNQLSGNGISIDISNVEMGPYLMVIESQKGSITKQFIKE